MLSSISYPNQWSSITTKPSTPRPYYPTPGSYQPVGPNWGGSSANTLNLLNLIISLLQQLRANIPSGGSINPAPAPISVSYSGTSAMINGKSYPQGFLQQAYEEFKKSPQFPTVATADLISTPWGYSGSSSVLNAFYSYVAQKYPNGSPSSSTTGQAGFGNQNPVNVSSNANSTSLNGQNFSSGFLRRAYEAFVKSPQYPSAQTLDLISTPWGYSGSGSVLTAFYNSLLQMYPRGEPVSTK